MMHHSCRAVFAVLAVLGMSGVTGAGSDQPDDTEDASGSEIDNGNQIEIEDTTRIILESSCPDEDPITAVAWVTGIVQRLGESESKSKNGEMWEVAAEIIEAPVDYARIEGTINDHVIAEDHEDGVLLTVEPCIRVLDPHEPSSVGAPASRFCCSSPTRLCRLSNPLRCAFRPACSC